eukprot:CAMPEP_0172155286 /NCGR_PEP_ID=MMETSP1050-20130122/2538_1 /TAXON_ID=233186 /ORGANISM="Cryptomonas curvata, Strain CCAP979/52" /LENGTH=718 /DNA_ID=CAMNT_0012824161 /DNA_START=44 /DNA_END=2195 /DNA_ORIENTATION=+
MRAHKCVLGLLSRERSYVVFSRLVAKHFPRRLSSNSNVLAEYATSLRILSNKTTKSPPQISSLSDPPDSALAFKRRLVRAMQRAKLPLPTFTTAKFEGEPHVVACKLIAAGQTFEGKGITESDAEDAAANVAYNALMDSKQLPPPTFTRKLLEAMTRAKLPPPVFTTAPVEGDPRSFHCSLAAAGRTFEGRGESQSDAEHTAARTAFQTLKESGGHHGRDLPGEAQRPPPTSDWRSLPTALAALRPVPSRWAAPVPRLAHGLSRVLHADNAVATTLRGGVAGEPLSPYLHRIVQPERINWEAIPPFTPASRDASLHALAVSHRARYKASTSSITGLLSHCYQVVSNFRPVETRALSKSFKDASSSFTLTQLKKPVVVFLRPRDGVWGIDSDPERVNDMAGNQILIDLGKTMERMLTMRPADFRRLVIKAPGGAEPVEIPREMQLSTYNFSRVGDFMLRSQLDCIYRGNQIFDLKTRATHAIRNAGRCGNQEAEPNKRYLDFLDYRIKYQEGLFNSFEREIYDMMRSCFLKYCYQIRIGRMDGAFVTYHNTREIFGFQYLTLDLMDARTFGSPHMAGVYFDRGCKLLERLLDEVVAGYRGQTVRLSLLPQRGRYLLIQANPVLSEVLLPVPPGLEGKEDPKVAVTLGPTTTWNLWVSTAINGKPTEQPWNFGPDDALEVSYNMVKLGTGILAARPPASAMSPLSTAASPVAAGAPPPPA